MTIIHQTPELEAAASRGNSKFWQGFVLTDDAGNYYTRTRFWQQTAGGLSSPQDSAPTQILGKNIGRANETTPQQQAMLEMAATEKKQRDKGYRAEGETTDEALMLPMLAHSWEKRKHSVTFPLKAQPKLDGVRCLCRDGVMWSRQGKPFIPEIYEHIKLRSTLGDVIFDGELMLPHAEYTFQDTMRHVKKHRPDSAQLEYHVYDCFLPGDPDAGFEKRYETLKILLKNCPAKVFLVETVTLGGMDDITPWHNHWTQPDQGFEGTILRSPDAPYTPGHRSVGLLKHKDMMDSEFEIVGVGEGVGGAEGAIMFTCVTDAGREFACGIKGSMDDRRDMSAHAESFMGQMLTVKYQNLTDDGLPRFPVGISVRDSDLQG
ncbi:MAG: ATP-dependent DNA ligase [Armatimonadota bacterium]